MDFSQYSKERTVRWKMEDLCRAHVDTTVNKIVSNFDLSTSFEERLGVRNGRLAKFGNRRYALIVQALLGVFIKCPNCRLSFRPTRPRPGPSISTRPLPGGWEGTHLVR